jgi:pyridoxamine 5'-phosphate oxidase family protein
MNNVRMPAMSFTEEEITYLRVQRLARIATVSPDGQPDVVPVGYQFDGQYYVGGMNPVKTRKFRNLQAGNPKVALVIDDLVSVNHWKPRYLRSYGTTELVARQEGQFGPGHYMRITPAVSWSWNIEGRSFTHDRKVVPRRTTRTCRRTGRMSGASRLPKGGLHNGR